jgi:hypothetical protein
MFSSFVLPLALLRACFVWSNMWLDTEPLLGPIRYPRSSILDPRLCRAVSLRCILLIPAFQFSVNLNHGPLVLIDSASFSPTS